VVFTTGVARELPIRCFAVSLAAAWALAGVPAIAGTTGALSGVVVDGTSGAPVPAALVRAVSASQVATTQTDAHGHFAFVSLEPDEYRLAVTKSGFDPLAESGLVVFADANQSLTLRMHAVLSTIAETMTRSRSSLVRPGTTSDIYSIDAAAQNRTAVLGGGGDLNSAYSAIASVPGAFVPANQSGYLQAVHIRGGDADQVGFEIDGIPVNRAFDNYPSGSVSSLGQLELQVYTGATPAGAEAQGLAGFVNQVLKTGTYPGTADADQGIGTPAFYHSLNVEAGGATPDRTFSYYIGIGGFNQEHRYIDQFNGASEADEFGSVLGVCPQVPPAQLPASCFTGGVPNVAASGMPGYLLGPITFNSPAVDGIATRTTVMNLHFALPHRAGNERDDLQLLYTNDAIFTTLLSSPSDAGFTAGQAGQPAYPSYLDTYQYLGATGTMLPPNYRSLIEPYLYPSSPSNRSFGAPIPLDLRDVGQNDQGIVKLQYQHNFSGSNAYLRIYGYTYYSDYITNGPNSSFQPYTGYFAGDYEENAHTRGVSATFVDQLDARNLLELQGSYTTATASRIYNQQMFGYGDGFAVLVNPNAVLSGTCYAVPAGSAGGAAIPTTCSDGRSNVITSGLPTFLSLAGAATGAAYPSAANYTCGSAACAFYVVGNGAYGQLNDVTPRFFGYALNDEWRPGDRMTVNAGLRLDQYAFYGGDTMGSPARNFWFAAFNQDTCFDRETLRLVDRAVLLAGGPWSTNAQLPCSSFGANYTNASLDNVPDQRFDYAVLQPRVGATYTLGADTVLRASYGKYNEQPSSAYQQYDSLQQNLPDELTDFYALGENTPGHAVAPSISYNYDVSLEHRFKRSNVSVKLTPFLRKTSGQIENFYTNPEAQIFSGVNVGSQTSEGFELGLQAGAFDRDGLAATLSFAYTNSYVTYGTLAYGASVLSPIDVDIQTYNAFTSYCAAHAADPRCGSGNAVDPNTQQRVVAAPCYALNGQPVASASACTPSDVANPYWNAPVQSLLDPGGRYVPYTVFPGAIGVGDNSFSYPYTATLVVTYRHGKLSITPSFQFEGGNRYGSPETMPGIDPALACGVLAGSAVGDPRYPYGAAGGAPYDADGAPGCTPGRLGAIPDAYTGVFDGIGAFREPDQLLGHLRIDYRFSKAMTGSVTFANLLQTCFAGQRTPFTYLWSSAVCSYTGLNPTISPVGNLYNPGDNVQTFVRYPYEPTFGVYNDISASINQPLSVYFSLNVRL